MDTYLIAGGYIYYLEDGDMMMAAPMPAEGFDPSKFTIDDFFWVNATAFNADEAAELDKIEKALKIIQVLL
jgi:hypothetical protein